MSFIPNPPVPFVGPLSGISPGAIIQVAGRTPPHAKWFAVNLQCGPNVNPRDDIALHVSPRFDGVVSKVVRNSLQHQQWGLEECFGHFPLALNQPFEMLILIETDRFKIAFNGQHYTEFQHRLPWQSINTLAIDGDIELISVRLENRTAQQQQSHGAPYAAASSNIPPIISPDSHSPSHTSHHGHLAASSTAMPVPGNKSPLAGYKQGLAGAAIGLVAGAATAYGASRLLYPGHNVLGGKKLKKMHKLKYHKPKKYGGHKKWGSSSSSSSSSSGSE